MQGGFAEPCPSGVKVVRAGRRHVVVAQPNVKQYGHQADEIVFALAYARNAGLPVVFRHPKVVASEAMFEIESPAVEIDRSRRTKLFVSASCIFEDRLAGLKVGWEKARSDLVREKIRQLAAYRAAHPDNPLLKWKLVDLKSKTRVGKDQRPQGPYWRRRLVADPVPIRPTRTAELRAVGIERQLGIDPDARLVTVHVREGGYKLGDETQDKGSRRHDSVRNARIETHFAAFDFLAERGYTIVRIGDPSMTPLEYPGLVDLATSPQRDPYFELYCLWRSDFLICGESGPQGAAYLTGTPSLTVNATDPVSSAPVRADGISLLKTVIDRASGRHLSLVDLLHERHLAHLRDPSRFIYVENTSEEILAAVEEMVELVESEGAAPCSPAQVRYKELLTRAVEDLRHLPYVRKWGIDEGFLGYGRLARLQAEKWLGDDADEALASRATPPAATVPQGKADDTSLEPTFELPGDSVAAPEPDPDGPASRPILFVLQHLGFVRNYEPTLRLLSARGYEVRIAYMEDRPGKDEGAFADALLRACPGIAILPAPAQASGRWPKFARALRLFADYVRYYDSRFSGASLVRARAYEYVPHAPKWAFELIGDRGVRRLLRILMRIELAIPTNRAAEAFVAEEHPSLLVVSPLVDFASPLVDYVKAARSQGIPSALCVASWDNLSNKGHMRIVPDRVFVWNDVQKEEAESLHGVPPENVVVTGAQLFDHWFDWEPVRTREEFCRDAGLDASRPFVVFLGSTHGVAPTEPYFVERWLRGVRGASDPRVAGLGVLIRPHPASADRYLSFDLSQVENAAIWPPKASARSEYYSDAGKRDFFESLYYSVAAVGLNTSALIEAAVVGRPVCTIRTEGTLQSQDGTVHFAYLASERNGLLRTADSTDAHLGDLARILDGDVDVERISSFVRHFVRPHGLERPAAPILADAIEDAAKLRVVPRRATMADRCLRTLVAPLSYSAALVTAQPGSREAPLWVRALRPLIWAYVRLVAVGIGLRITPERMSHLKRAVRKRVRKALQRIRRRIVRVLQVVGKLIGRRPRRPGSDLGRSDTTRR